MTTKISRKSTFGFVLLREYHSRNLVDETRIHNASPGLQGITPVDQSENPQTTPPGLRIPIENNHLTQPWATTELRDKPVKGCAYS
jgi:hypothetical protein